jgi:SAM-dependent methyltransferase
MNPAPPVTRTFDVRPRHGTTAPLSAEDMRGNVAVSEAAARSCNAAHLDSGRMPRLRRRPPDDARRNLDTATVEGFGAEWSRFDQAALPDDERAQIFEQYFAVFPWDALPEGAVGFDLGCGSGRWAALVAPRVGMLHCVDASPEALDVARRNLLGHANCAFHVASVDALPFAAESMDFGYALGVLHHVPDTQAAIAAAVRPLRRGAPLLLYLYYAFDNRPAWYRAVWRASDLLRRVISRSPVAVKTAVTSAIAAVVYLPLARSARLLERLGVDVERVPLSFYRDRGFYTMRTDAFDRFATRLEQRFTAGEIEAMMRAAGLDDVVVSPEAPYWCAVGRRAAEPAVASVSPASPGGAAPESS